MLRAYLLLSVFYFSIFVAQAQKKCVTNLGDNEADRASLLKLQQWVSSTYAILKGSRSAEEVSHENVYTIPVVFHVIYANNNENIPDSQIESQLEILNNDFRRKNRDTTNTPSMFLDIVADTKIEFQLAKRDPDQNPTSGIIRVPADQDEYDIENFEDRRKLSLLSHWDASYYLNIVVCNAKDPILGYASFPITSLVGAEGLGEQNELLDAVFVDYRFLGNRDKASSQSEGRTATHEIGHYLGLLHTFEGFSSTCKGNGDFCDDTPSMSESTSFSLKNCDESKTDNFCGSDSIMIDNFLDYSPDACMNLFTKCQKNRMRIVLENSPRRLSLLSSPAINESNDLAIKRIISPLNGECSDSYTPSIELRNVGTNDISNFVVELYTNNKFVEAINNNVFMPAGISTTKIEFSSLSLRSGIQHILSFRIKSTNGVADGNNENDVMESVTCAVQKLFAVNPTIIRSGSISLNINANLSEDIFLTLLNSTGRIAFQRRFSADNSGEATINVSGLGNGIYFLRLLNGNSVQVERIIISR